MARSSQNNPAPDPTVAELQTRIIALEHELAQAQSNNNAFFDQALALLCTADFNGYFQQLNPMWERVLGFTREELCAEPFLNFVHPEDREATLAAAQQLGAEGRDVVAFENRYRCKDGSYRWLRWNSAPDMQLGRIYAVVQDITLERETSTRLLQSETRLRQIMVNIPGAVFQFTVRNGVWMIDFVSDRIEAISGLSAAAMMDDVQAFIMRIHPDDQAAYLASVYQALDYLQPWHFEGRFLHTDGSVRWFQGDSTPLKNEAGEIIFNGVMMDITERREADEIRRQNRLQEEIILAQRATLEELSTPLIPINERIVVMPLIGSVDSRRAQQVLETLLQGIEETHAEVAILDITGVSVVDTQVANALIRAAQAVKLLGAQVMLTGIRPEVAQTLVGLGVDLGGLITRSSLQSGIALAMRR